MIHHLPVVLSQLTWLLMRVNSEEVSVNVTKVLIHIVHQLHQVNKGHLLDAYLHYVGVAPADPALKLTVHEEMVKTLCALLRPSNADFLVTHKFLRHAGFFLQLIARSMAQHILETGRIKVSAGRDVDEVCFCVFFTWSILPDATAGKVPCGLPPQCRGPH